MDCISVREAAECWNVSERWIQKLCEEGRIPGVKRFGRSWMIPKSVHKDRMEQNMDIWDFTLSDADMEEVSKLDIGHSEIVNHNDPKFVQMLHSMKIHQ